MESVSALPRYCQRLYERELVSSTGGNISMRSDRGSILISPTGKALVDLKPDDFVEVSLAGEVVIGDRPSKELPFHLAAYQTRPDVMAVIHGHCAFVVAASTLLASDPIDSLPAYTAGYVMRVGRLPLLPYLPAGSVELSRAVAEVLTPSTRAILLQNHGFISVGPDLETAFNTADELLDAVKVYVLSGGRALPLPKPAREELLTRVAAASSSSLISPSR